MQAKISLNESCFKKVLANDKIAQAEATIVRINNAGFLACMSVYDAPKIAPSVDKSNSHLPI